MEWNFQTLHLERQQQRVNVRLKRPEVRNAFDSVMIDELTHAFEGLAGDPTVHVVVLSGDGKVFSAGADIQWMRDSIELTEEQNRQDAAKMARMFNAIAEAPFPVIVRAHGAAMGGGAGLVCAGDMTVASSDCIFSFSEVRLGIIPAVISPHALEKIGASEARRWFLTGERFDAATAQRIGMIHEVSETENLDSVVDAWVAELESGGPEAIRAAKKLIREVLSSPRSEVTDLTSRRIAERRATAEGQGGLRAFLDRTPPPWKQPADSSDE